MNKGADIGVSTPSNETLNFALAYKEKLNLSIFPIYYKSKVPITQRGFKDSSKDTEQIIKWFTKYPYAGIGLPTGEINNLIIVDIDPRNSGDVSLQRLFDEHGQFPHTIQCLTAGGGQHYYFKYDERINKKEIKGYPGIDLLSNGQYAVLPPSTHPNGKQYFWKEDAKPVLNEAAEIPEWLVKKILETSNNNKSKKDSLPRRSGSYWEDLFNNTTEGNRNNNVASFVGHLLRRYIDPILVKEITYLWNETKINPSLDTNELDTIINSVASMELKRRNK